MEQPCNSCNGKRYRLVSAGDFAKAIRCETCFEVCTTCYGEGYEYLVDDKGYSYVRRCSDCGELDHRMERFNKAKIPSRYSENTTFEAFQRTGPGGKSLGNLKDVHLKLYRFATGYTPGDKGFLLWGNVGTGKTHLLATVVRHLTLEKGISARFVEFTHLLSEIRGGFDQGKGEAQVLSPILDLPVLAIDELGKGRNNEWQSSIIDEIVSKRYNKGLTTLWTTNYPIKREKLKGSESIRGVTRETLQDRVGDRIFSRLHEMAETIQLEAPDFRAKPPGS